MTDAWCSLILMRRAPGTTWVGGWGAEGGPSDPRVRHHTGGSLLSRLHGSTGPSVRLRTGGWVEDCVARSRKSYSRVTGGLTQPQSPPCRPCSRQAELIHDVSPWPGGTVCCALHRYPPWLPAACIQMSEGRSRGSGGTDPSRSCMFHVKPRGHLAGGKSRTLLLPGNRAQRRRRITLERPGGAVTRSALTLLGRRIQLWGKRRNP